MDHPLPLIVTENAARRIIAITADEPNNTAFRIAVNGGGCSGFQLDFKLDAAPPAEGDLVVEKDGARVVIDDVSLGLLNGSTLDYVEDLGSAGFELKNPNSTARCGCGNSFAV